VFHILGLGEGGGVTKKHWNNIGAGRQQIDGPIQNFRDKAVW